MGGCVELCRLRAGEVAAARCGSSSGFDRCLKTAAVEVYGGERGRVRVCVGEFVEDRKL